MFVRACVRVCVRGVLAFLFVLWVVYFFVLLGGCVRVRACVRDVLAFFF